MASDLETRAKEAFIDDHFDLAVDLYFQALSLSPKNPDLYSDRAQANIKLKSFTEAVSDANRAIELDPSMSKAYLRKGTACFSLEEFQTAKAAFESGASLSPEDKRFTNWIEKCDKAIAVSCVRMHLSVNGDIFANTEEAATVVFGATLTADDIRFTKWIEKCDKFMAEAVSDANLAIELDPSMSKAYPRKGTACFRPEEFQTAKSAFESGASLAPEDKRFINWIEKCDKVIAEEAATFESGASLATEDKRFTNWIEKCDMAIAEKACELTRHSSDVAHTASQLLEKADATPKDSPPFSDISGAVTTVSPAKPKYRHEFFQKPEEVVVTIFAKGIPAKCVAVDFGEQILSVTIEKPGEDAYNFQPRLFGKIVPAKCKYEVLSTKIEIRLAKAEAIQWTSLEFSRDNLVVQKINASSAFQRPTYPSSKSKTDWDKLEAEVKKEEKDEKLDGDAALNKFFREIYSDADEDTRRAMRKSFVESNGTVLSTNWKEVGAKKVEGTPPDGMELKKWEI